MIAFFAFNNTNVVTMLNLKMNYFGDEEAYLLVKGSPIISEELLNSIKDAKVFSGIYVLDVPRINMKEVRWKHIKGVRVFAKTQKINNYYQRILDSYFEGRIFDKVFIHGGWNDTIYLLNYCCRSNKKVEIDFVEEGTVTYSYTRKQLFNVRPGIKKKTARIISRLSEWKYAKQGKRNLTSKVYVYSKETYQIVNKDKKTELYCLPKIDDNNLEVKKLVEGYIENYSDIIGYYRKRKVIYLTDYFMEKEQHKLIEILLNNVTKNKIVLKLHTGATVHRLGFAKDLCNKNRELYADREIYYFEAICSTVDFSDKVIISRGSSVMVYIKLLYNQEPYVIFTHKLFYDYCNEGDALQFDDYVETMKRLYDNKERIMVPTSIYEYKTMLKEAYSDVLGY